MPSSILGINSRATRYWFLLLAAGACWLFCSPAAIADRYAGDVVYQVITDRFFNGRTDNDDPEKSKGLFDSSKKNWHAYWGGDLAGIKKKLQYIKHLGATAIWISPPTDNVNKPVNDANGKMTAPYHGYHSRDFKRVEEHFGDKDNSWKDFDELTKAAHELGIKVIIDLPANHTSLYNHGEFGVLYDDGHFKGDTEYDRNKYFHHLPLVKDYNNRYELQYGTIFYLGDLAQENSFVDRYLKASASRFLKHGADGTRLDTAKHITWGWEHTLANTLYNLEDHLVVGEWWMDSVSEPLYRDAVKFSNQGGITLFDFPLNRAIRSVFGTKKAGFQTIADVLKREDADFYDPKTLLTFIDNHDMSRFLNLNEDKKDLHLALTFLLTCRGIPVIYYGTEQYLYTDTKNGEDPYNRQWMSSFDETTPAFKLIQRLCKLRTTNPAFAYGKLNVLSAHKDRIIFERTFGSNVAVIALNLGTKNRVEKDSSSLPPGSYPDLLNGKLGGVDKRSSPDSPIFNLPPQSVSIWSHVAKKEEPLIGSVRPPVVNGGIEVTINGLGFGDESGKVLVGSEEMEVSKWAPSTISFRAPHLLSGRQPVKVVTRSGIDSNSASIIVREGKLLAITIAVNKAPLLEKDQQLFITGNISTLGNWKKTWMEAAGPLLLSEDRNYILSIPLPASKSIEYKCFILDKNGKVVKTESKTHSYKVPEVGTWKHEIDWRGSSE